MVFRRHIQLIGLYTYLVVGMLLIMIGCGVRETATSLVPATSVEEGYEMPTNVTVPSTVTSQAITPTPDVYLRYGDANSILILREELTRTDLSDEDRAFYEAKLAQAEFEASKKATAQVGPTAVRRGPPPVIADDTTPPRGILTEYNDIFKRKIDIRNVWQDEVDGVWWQIYAGAIAAEPEKGILVARKMEADGTPRTSYETPIQVGAVRIIAEQNQQLTLEAEDGTLFVFDLPSREFVDSSLAVTPTPTVVTE